MASLQEAFEQQLSERPHALALWSRREGLHFSFRQLAERAEARRRELRLAHREHAKAPVALATGSTASFCELFIALLKEGVPAVAMDANLAQDEKERLCRRLGIPTLLTLEKPADGGPSQSRVRRYDLAVAPAPLPPGTALVKLTSGSTGAPHAPCFGEEELLWGIRQIAEGMDLSPRHRVLLVIPLSHSYGFDNGLLSMMTIGTPLILDGALFPAALLRTLAETRATFLPLVPPLVRGLGQVAWPAGLPLETVICAGGTLPRSAAAAFAERSGRPVHDFYGSSETGGITFERRPRDPEAAGTVGQPLPGVRVELDGSGTVVVHSRANHLGLLGRHGTERTGRSVRTSDTAQWTPEGRLRLTGRSADLLNVGGRKVPAVRLEDALRQLEGVLEAAVVGVPDEARGERAVAFLVTDRWPVDTATLPTGLTPREHHRLERLPHTARGKLDRAQLKRRAQELARSSGK